MCAPEITMERNRGTVGEQVWEEKAPSTGTKYRRVDKLQGLLQRQSNVSRV